ncbi:MAG: hypothetical protein GC164_01710 [Phycisphaera sp.]|nr:hypothetical protein [Phycisphaera sp.]
MIPPEPQRRPQLGFLYIHPYRIQGLSVAGEESVVHIPELDLCFDIGLCPRPALAANYCALTHGHMDHAAALTYYLSQRHFQGMGTGTVICPPALEKPIRQLMTAWIDIEAQRTPYNLIALQPDSEIEIKRNFFLRAFATRHTVPSLGYVVIERRSKLRPEYVGLTQPQLVQLKQAGKEITHTLEVPLICYTGDTAYGEHFERDDVKHARILITECTFTEAGHKDRADVGKHMHIDDIVRVLKSSTAEAVVLTHLSRRTHMGQARKEIESAINATDRDRVLLLMDSRTNKARYEKQREEAALPKGD